MSAADVTTMATSTVPSAALPAPRPPSPTPPVTAQASCAVQAADQRVWLQASICRQDEANACLPPAHATAAAVYLNVQPRAAMAAAPVRILSHAWWLHQNLRWGWHVGERSDRVTAADIRAAMSDDGVGCTNAQLTRAAHDVGLDVFRCLSHGRAAYRHCLMVYPSETPGAVAVKRRHGKSVLAAIESMRRPRLEA